MTNVDGIPDNQPLNDHDVTTAEYMQLLSEDSEDDEEKKAQDKIALLKSGNVQKLLMQIPPSHEQAEIHGVIYFVTNDNAVSHSSFQP